MDKEQKKVWTILSTPDDIEFKKFREEHDTMWLTKEREYLYIQDMTSAHIVSCINILERVGQEYTKAYDGLTKELTRRTHFKLDRWRYEN